MTALGTMDNTIKNKNKNKKTNKQKKNIQASLYLAAAETITAKAKNIYTYFEYLLKADWCHINLCNSQPKKITSVLFCCKVVVQIQSSLTWKLPPQRWMQLQHPIPFLPWHHRKDSSGCFFPLQTCLGSFFPLISPSPQLQQWKAS